jgi:hypothetical protein
MLDGAKRPTRRRPCTDPSHRRMRARPGNCLDCAMARQRQRNAEKRAARGEVLLDRPGVSAHRAGALAMWERRKAVYGPTGNRPKADRPPRKAAPRRARQTHCKHGHRLDRANVTVHTYMGTTRRRCRTCARRRTQGVERPEMVTVPGGGRVSVVAHDAWCVAEGQRLWAAVLASHPDRPTGAVGKFRDAHKRWTRFLATEEAWYQAVGLALPDGMKKGVS